MSSFEESAKLGFNTLHASHPEMLPKGQRVALFESMSIHELLAVAHMRKFCIAGHVTKEGLVKALTDHFEVGTR